MIRCTIHDGFSLVSVVFGVYEVGDLQVVYPVDDVAGEEAKGEQFPAGLVHQLGRVAPSPRVAAS